MDQIILEHFILNVTGEEIISKKILLLIYKLMIIFILKLALKIFRQLTLILRIKSTKRVNS
jgi:hypothetical protein